MNLGLRSDPNSGFGHSGVGNKQYTQQGACPMESGARPLVVRELTLGKLCGHDGSCSSDSSVFTLKPDPS